MRGLLAGEMSAEWRPAGRRRSRGDSPAHARRHRASPGRLTVLPARFEKVASARDAVRTLLGAAHAPQEAISLTELAAGELVANGLDTATMPEAAAALIEHVLRGEPAADDIAVLVARFEITG